MEYPCRHGGQVFCASCEATATNSPAEMTVRTPGHGPRDWLGSVLSKWADRLLYGDGHTLIVRDGNGNEIFNLTTSGGYAASNPPPPYTLECCDEKLA